MLNTVFCDRRNTLSRFAAVLVFVLFISSTIVSQSFRGKILGTITDQNGAVIQGATVVARNVGTGIERTTITDADGNYSISELPIGTYEVKASAKNFQAGTLGGVIVEVAADRRADVILGTTVGSVSVDVLAEEQVETSSTTLGGTIQTRAVADLPVNGRDFTKFLVLVPGASGDPSGATDSPGSFGLFSANGNRGRSNNYLIDGTDMNDGYRNLPAINEAGVFGTPATILPLEGIQEVAVLSNFEAEYGRNSGSVVNIVTKSGTNNFHGALFEFFRNDKTDARNFFNFKPDAKTHLNNNQFGGSLGGPIVKNKTFFYVNYEGQRERVGLNSTARIPDPREIQATLEGHPCGGGGDRFGGIILNPVIGRLLALNPWGTPNHPLPVCDDSGDPNLFVTTPASNDVDSFIGKIDHSFNDHNQITGRYYYGSSDQSFPLAILGGNILPGYNTVTPTRVDLVSISYLKIFSSTKVNEVRFGYNRFDQGFFPEDQAFDPHSIGLNNGTTNSRDFGLPLGFRKIRI